AEPRPLSSQRCGNLPDGDAADRKGQAQRLGERCSAWISRAEGRPAEMGSLGVLWRMLARRRAGDGRRVRPPHEGGREHHEADAGPCRRHNGASSERGRYRGVARREAREAQESAWQPACSEQLKGPPAITAAALTRLKGRT